MAESLITKYIDRVEITLRFERPLLIHPSVVGCSRSVVRNFCFFGGWTCVSVGGERTVRRWLGVQSANVWCLHFESATSCAVCLQEEDLCLAWSCELSVAFVGHCKDLFGYHAVLLVNVELSERARVISKAPTGHRQRMVRQLSKLPAYPATLKIFLDVDSGVSISEET